jgi:hypothetical protein
MEERRGDGGGGCTPTFCLAGPVDVGHAVSSVDDTCTECVDEIRLDVLVDGRNTHSELATLDEKVMGSAVVIEGRMNKGVVAVLGEIISGLTVVVESGSEGSGP